MKGNFFKNIINAKNKNKHGDHDDDHGDYNDSNEEEESPRTRPKRLALFDLMNTRMSLGMTGHFAGGVPIEKIPKAMFIMLLVLLYIANTHFADKTVRKIEKLKKEVEDLRADYMTMKASLMFESKQSEVARKMTTIGVGESSEPPFYVEAEKDGN